MKKNELLELNSANYIYCAKKIKTNHYKLQLKHQRDFKEKVKEDQNFDVNLILDGIVHSWPSFHLNYSFHTRVLNV